MSIVEAMGDAYSEVGTIVMQKHVSKDKNSIEQLKGLLIHFGEPLFYI